MPRMLDLLGRESIAAVGRKRRKTWERVVEEITGEIAHLTS